MLSGPACRHYRAWGPIIRFFTCFVSLVFFVLWWVIFWFVVRSAVTAATESLRTQQNQMIQIAMGQADLQLRLTKHLALQTELMTLQARHSGISNDELASIEQHLAEPKAEPPIVVDPANPMQLPFR